MEGIASGLLLVFLRQSLGLSDPSDVSTRKKKSSRKKWKLRNPQNWSTLPEKRFLWFPDLSLILIFMHIIYLSFVEDQFGSVNRYPLSTKWTSGGGAWPGEKSIQLIL